MKQFLITIAGVFVALTLIVVAVPLALLAWATSVTRPAPVAERTVLVLDLRGKLSDQASQSPLADLGGKGLSVMSIEEGLRQAAKDQRVKGLFVRLPEGGMAPAAADELRLAFLRFRAAGKPILAHSQGLYATGMISSTYELAAAAGNVWMQPASTFQVTGLSREEIFYKRFFDQHGVTADYQQRYEFKTAVNPYLYSDFTPAHRQSDLSWLESVYETALSNAAHDRGKPAAALRSMIEAGPWSAEDAKAKGLIDAVGQVREAAAASLSKAGDGAKLMEFTEYAENTARQGAGDAGAPTLAVISAEGAIMTGAGPSSNPLAGGEVIHSDDIAKAFYDAIEDRSVKAIVFRVSSPGGSDTASEQILAAVRAAKAAGKPVVVSMGTYAASGGYWISSAANEIVAEPSTLTGSIGVFGGKFALGGALARFGVDVRDLKVGGDYADAFGAASPMSATQRAGFSAWMDRIYEGFVARVASGRHLTPDRVREIAKGRVWTGAQAMDLGLVDHLGGFYEATARARALAGITGLARLKSFNPHPSPFEALERLVGGGATDAQSLAGALSLLQTPIARGMIGDLSDSELRTQGATVLAPRLAR